MDWDKQYKQYKKRVDNDEIDQDYQEQKDSFEKSEDSNPYLENSANHQIDETVTKKGFKLSPFKKPSSDKKDKTEDSNLGSLPKLAWLLLLGLILLAIWMIYMLSPFTSVSSLTVTGNEVVDTQEVIQASTIKPYMSSNYLKSHNEVFEGYFQHASPYISSAKIVQVQANSFEIQVDENRPVANYQDNTEYFKVLADGFIIDQALSVALDGLPILRDFTKNEQIDQVSRQLSELDLEVFDQVEQIKYLGLDKNPFKIEIIMRDGQKITSSLTDFAKKLNYYPQIKAEIGDQVGVIDMEVGIYFSPNSGEKMTGREIRLNGD